MIVATPESSGVAMVGGGRPGVAPQTAKREQCARLIARGVFLGGVPDRRDQPPDGEALATRPHGHQQQRSPAALCAGDHYPEAGDLGAVPVRGRAGRDRRPAPARCRVRAIAREIGRDPSTISRELRRNRDPEQRAVSAVRRAAAGGGASGPAEVAASSLHDAVLREFVQAPAQAAVEPGADQPRAARPSSPTSRSGTWCTRRSIRRSTGPDSAACTASCRRRCGPGGGAASRTAARTSAAGGW